VRAALNTQALKFVAGALVVGAAFCIMMPDLLRYLAGLWRLGVFVVVVVVAARAAAIVLTRKRIASAGGAGAAPHDEGPAAEGASGQDKIS